MARILLGLSFHAESVKAVAIDVNSGNMVGRAIEKYSKGVIRENLPTGERIPAGFVLADPKAWLVSMKGAIARLMNETGIPPPEIISLGVSMESCVVLPTDSFGVPLCMKEEFASNPHAWPKLWNHRGAAPQAEKLTKIARDRGEPFLDQTGNRVSSEWMWPKLLEVIEKSPEVAQATEWFIEGSDWIVWQLTGNQIRNLCSAGYKACYIEGIGYPSGAFFENASFDLARIAEKVRSVPVLPSGRFVGGLLPEAAQNLGLMPDLSVGAGVISNHVGVVGAGVYEPGVLTLVFGDSTAHMLMSDEEKIFEGYSCMVKDGIVDGYWGYEAGQPATGELFEWFKNILSPVGLSRRAESDDVDDEVVLDRWLSEVPPGSNGVLSLEWFDGNKSVLFDPSLSGVITGLKLGTTPAQIYKSLVEATAFGTKKIIQAFKDGGLKINKIVAIGSVPFKSPSRLQIYADVIGLPIHVPDTPEAIARGTAIIGAMSVDTKELGYKGREAYFEAMKSEDHDYFEPNENTKKIYEEIYEKYSKLHDMYGLK